MRRSLIYYWRINLAVMMGAAVATAVLSGALLVGDSVRGSLRDLALDRLGKVDFALSLNRFVRQDLADDIFQDARFQAHFDKAVPAILSIGSITHAKTKAHAAGVNLLGVDQHFADLFPDDSTSAIISLSFSSPDQIFPSVVINEALRKELNANVGDDILINLQRPSDIHRETLLGSRKVSDLVKTARFTITRILPDRGLGRFGLRSNQQLPLNVYASLAGLQKVIDQKGKTNTFLFAGKEIETSDSLKPALEKILRQSIKLEDYGITSQQSGKFISVESSEIVLDPLVARIVEETGKESGASIQAILTYLANTIQVENRLLPYSTITAIETVAEKPFDELRLIDGSHVSALGENEILLNEWAAEDLMARVGDRVELSYYAVGSGEQLLTQSADFRMAGIVKMQGLGADPSLTPEFPGIHDAEDMQSWDPPFPVDLNLIRQKDETYWDRYRASPKAFVSLTAGQRLWSSRFGNLTSIRVGVPASTSANVFHENLQSRLLERLSPEQMGFALQNVKQQALDAASGATDFSMLFVGFSFFLIISAALLVGMLFRLSVEQRADEIGTLLAIGFPVHTVRRRLLSEGVILAGVGCLLGLLGAVGYAGLMIFGLRTWWADAIGSPFLFLHVNVMSLVIGYFAALAVTLFSITWAVRQLSRIPAPALLHGVTTFDHASPAKWSRMIAIASMFTGVILAAVAFFAGAASSAGLFFTIGALVLISGLAALSLRFRKLRRLKRKDFGFARILRMSIDYGARNPGRSILSAGLVCCASFIIIAVAANRRDFGADLAAKNSGTGGFALVAQSDIPLHHDLNTKAGLVELGFADENADSLAGVRFFSMRTLRGEDASCLNLYKPEQPHILGAAHEQLQRGGFSFHAVIEKNPEIEQNPWLLLEKEIAPEVVPAIGDYNSAQWIMHLGLGKDLVVRNEFGKEIKLRFVGLLESSIFQSEVIISEKHFLRNFPGVDGYAKFLIESPGANVEKVGSLLEKSLRDYGFDATSTREKLASFQAVENTYLSVFQTLGGLGLLLGTVGLGIILIRNAFERRGELATLRAFGFRRATLTFMLVAENAYLILAGIAIGAISALLAVAPHLTSGNAQVPWLALCLTLFSVLLVGLIASAVSAAFALRIPLLPALKAE